MIIPMPEGYKLWVADIADGSGRFPARVVCAGKYVDFFTTQEAINEKGVLALFAKSVMDKYLKRLVNATVR